DGPVAVVDGAGVVRHGVCGEAVPQPPPVPAVKRQRVVDANIYDGLLLGKFTRVHPHRVISTAAGRPGGKGGRCVVPGPAYDRDGTGHTSGSVMSDTCPPCASTSVPSGM